MILSHAYQLLLITVKGLGPLIHVKHQSQWQNMSALHQTMLQILHHLQLIPETTLPRQSHRRNLLQTVLSTLCLRHWVINRRPSLLQFSSGRKFVLGAQCCRHLLRSSLQSRHDLADIVKQTEIQTFCTTYSLRCAFKEWVLNTLLQW